MNRASDSGSEGRAFESHRGHWRKEENRQRFSSFLVFASDLAGINKAVEILLVQKNSSLYRPPTRELLNTKTKLDLTKLFCSQSFTAPFLPAKI